ncbi:MAG TPA: SDR family oxidoreductase [Streptosporangiaceae bacterium]|nr:SDR family oxidoreductase [Streptosporangiaceae bacterium]
MGRLAGKVALVSGSARGMGEATVRAFVAEGAHVVVSDVLDEVGGSVVRELGDSAIYEHLDVTSDDDWRRAVHRASDVFGKLDILVNNAGISGHGTVETTTESEYVDVFRVNQLGVFLGMRAAAPVMKETGGSIINISSVSGLIGQTGLFAYGASKWAVRGMTKSAARDLGRYGIRVNSVHPAGVVTEFLKGNPGMNSMYSRQPIQRRAVISEIVPLIIYLASNESSYATGSEFVLDGGMTSGNDLEAAEAPSV